MKKLVLISIVFFLVENFSQVIQAQVKEVSIDRAPRHNTNQLSVFYNESNKNLYDGYCYGNDALGNTWLYFLMSNPDSLSVISNLSDFISGGDFSADGFYYGTLYSNSSLVKVDPATGSMTTISTISGVTSGFTVTSLAFDPTTLIMYLGATNSNGSELYTINLSSGNAILIGSITNNPALIALAINNEGSIYGVDILTDNLTKIDKNTGEGIVVGPIGYDLNYAQDADFDPATNNLYLTAYANEGMLLKADTTTGSCLLLASYGNLEITAFGINNPYIVSVGTDINQESSFVLDQNFPNPFNPSTTINFSLAVDSKVSLKIFDVLGQEVATLINGQLAAGSQEVSFNASLLNSGVYFYRIDANGVDGQKFSSVKKMILTK
jgi:hypothetical protein